jgi:hypothetical protein
MNERKDSHAAVTLLTLILAICGTLAICAMTEPGREILKQIGFRNRVPGAASTEDVEYLLAACGRNPEEVSRRLDIERARFTALSEAEHYRGAIRKVFAERKS